MVNVGFVEDDSKFYDEIFNELNRKEENLSDFYLNVFFVGIHDDSYDLERVEAILIYPDHIELFSKNTNATIFINLDSVCSIELVPKKGD